MRFEPAPEYQVFPTREHPLKPYEAAVRAARETQPLIADVDPEIVVADILTIAAGLAAELAGRPWATLVPHVLPVSEPGFPPYSIGARLPRTPVGSALWRALDPIVRAGTERGRDELNETRRRLGLAPLDHVHGGISRELALVATFPQLEYPRTSSWPWVRVTGPLMYERPADDVELPPGDDPLVLVAPSTSQDRKQRMLRAALAGLADEVEVVPGPGGAPVEAEEAEGDLLDPVPGEDGAHDPGGPRGDRRFRTRGGRVGRRPQEQAPQEKEPAPRHSGTSFLRAFLIASTMKFCMDGSLPRTA